MDREGLTSQADELAELVQLRRHCKTHRWYIMQYPYRANAPFPTLLDAQYFNDAQDLGGSACLESASRCCRRFLKNIG